MVVDRSYVEDRISELVKLRDSEFVSLQELIIIDELLYCYRIMLEVNNYENLLNQK